MTDLPFRTAVDLAAAIRRKEVGCRELLELYVSRIERFNPRLNAIVVFDLDRARRRADEADAALAAWTLEELDGEELGGARWMGSDAPRA